VVLAALVACTFFGPSQAEAYIGPGAGFAFVGSFMVLLGAFFAVFAALLVMPVRMLIRRMATRKQRAAAKVQRVVIVGLDGMDPELAQQFMAEGKMPNFQAMADQGVFRPLDTTTPSMSPVAWSSFMTGVDPGRHGIFDFITRDPCTYMPLLSSAFIGGSKKTLKLGKYVIPLGKPIIRLLRKSKPFWKILGDNWVFSSIIRVPITFPPEKFKNGVLLSGMCVPDLKGTQGSFSFFTTKLRGRIEDETAGMAAENAGGTEIEVKREGNVVRGELEGPMNSMVEGGGAMTLPWTLTLNDDQQSASFEISGHSVELKLREYSPWLTLEFQAMPMVKVSGIARFYLQQTDPEVELYVTPIQIDPAKPAMPISEPAVYSVYLAKLLGPYATLGLAEDTWALNERRIDEEAFLKQAWLHYEEREKMLWDAIDKTRRGLVTCVFDTTDRIQHMFFRYLDPKHPANRGKDTEKHKGAIEQLYTRMDDLIGRVKKKVDDENTVLIVMSDHGFKQFQRGVNLNAWLRDEGYLVLKDGQQTGSDWFDQVDWSKTKAFTMGLTGLFINRKGREVAGIVEEGEELHQLKNEIADKLRHLVDPGRDNVPVMREVFDTTAHLNGPYNYEAPDLLIGYEAGYRHSWDCAVGCTSKEVFSDNTKSWSGDHCMDPRIVPGIFFCNRDINTQAPNILDLAPTMLYLFGVPIPNYMQGVPLFGDRPEKPAPPKREAEPVAAAS
jgi:predicted AlkP superfamily phosphohydrolase/phosphomutase